MENCKDNLPVRLFSYVLAYDFGFAPNPFYGFCTLATCKPTIREHAALGDWVVGTGAKTNYDLAGHLIYAMKVDEIIDFDSYWNDPRFLCKRPVLNGSLKQLYGDNIYCHRDGRWIQADSRHSHPGGEPNQKNIERDTSSNHVLVAQRFVYFGSVAPLIPQRVLHYEPTGDVLCCLKRGYRNGSDEFASEFESWINDRGELGVQGMPLEFNKRNRIIRDLR